MASASGQHITMVGKALRLLTLLGEYPDGVGLSEAARGCGYPVSTTHRLLGSLVDGGFASFDGSSRRYRLGLAVFALGLRVSRARGFGEAVSSVLYRVTQHTSEATLMSVRDGTTQLYVHYVEGPRQVQVIGDPGRHGPLHCTSMGKCLLAFAARHDRDAVVGKLAMRRLGPRTITDRGELRRELARVKECGYAIADEEHEEGIRAVGVPVLGPDGTAVAAISTAAPAYRMPLARLTEFVPVLTGAATELALVLPPGRRRRAD